MLEIDGSQTSGSGTIVRDAVPLAALIREPLLLTNIRARRDKPGLRPQHLKAVEAAASVSGGRLEGAEVGSRQIRFHPGPALKGGSYEFSIGTAGSAAMLALSLLPLALFSDGPSTYRISGGLFQDWAPPVHALQHVVLPLLRSMGAEAQLEILRPGYVPRGGGRLALRVTPLLTPLEPLQLPERGRVKEIEGIALASRLAKRRVSERMEKACRRILEREGHPCRLRIVEDEEDRPAYAAPAPQPGASLTVWAVTDRGCILGADMAGAPRRSAEFIGKETARALLRDLRSGATVDRHAADQLIPFAALARGTTGCRIPEPTDHVEARLWLVREILGAGTGLSGTRMEIRGAARCR